MSVRRISSVWATDATISAISLPRGRKPSGIAGIYTATSPSSRMPIKTNMSGRLFRKILRVRKFPFIDISEVSTDSIPRCFVLLDSDERWLGGLYDWEQMAWKWAASGKPLTYQAFGKTIDDKEELRWHCIIMDPRLQYRYVAYYLQSQECCRLGNSKGSTCWRW